ncbi:MAG: hypothetical protein HC892_05640 [Saprospiraceae bacterium]|nr:hypothetical protein [Saprospiraceae bacterium]
MQLLFNDIFLEHETGNHPENKKRLGHFMHLPNTSYPAARAYLDLVHTAAYVEKVEKSCQGGLWLDGDTMTSPKSFDVAIAGVGMALRAMQEKNFAIMRPPGHHAYPNKRYRFLSFLILLLLSLNTL